MQPYQVKKAFELAEIFQQRLQRDLYCCRQAMQCEFASCPQATPFSESLGLSYQSITPGEKWGSNWQTGYFRFTGCFLPPAEADLIPVCQINTGSEALLYDVNGKALSGLTAYCWFKDDFVRDIYYPAVQTVEPGKEITYYCAVTANKLAGLDVNYDPPFAMQSNGSFTACLQIADTMYLRKNVQQLIWDIQILRSLASTLREQDYRRRSIARALDRAENVYADDPANAAAARGELQTLLSLPACSDALTVTAVGHSHLDTAYMWPIREGIQKCGRTFATQMELIENSPDYIFGASQPQHDAFTKKHFPELYCRVKSAVAAGRWEPQGGMWVEPDTNVPDGESLVRQFLHGKNFFKDEFNVEVRNLWLPDVFGYTAALPQIMKLADCDNLISIKLSTNDCNNFPYKTFRWKGIDGTEVLAHFPPEGFYSSSLQPATLCKAQDDYWESAEVGEFISLFGLGDGGAGATRAELESGRRLANLQGAPKVKFSAAQEALDRMHQHWESLPVWNGELYLERHRGATTSLSWLKRSNRKLEQLLPAVEFFCTISCKDYPAEQLDQAWKLLLLHQFHDIMAGTSLDETYEESARDHRLIRQLADECLQNAAAGLTAADKFSFINTLNTAFSGIVQLPKEWKFGLCDSANNVLPAVQNPDGSVSVQLELPPMSTACFSKAAVPECETVSLSGQTVLENELIAYTFDSSLRLISAYDKEFERELIKPGQYGNAIKLYRDYPAKYDAWDVDRHYRDRAGEAAVNPVGKLEKRSGSLGVALSAVMCCGNSQIKQVVRLQKGSRLLEFSTVVDWQEERKMLRVEFPVDIQSDFATYDVQFGSTRRPTHENTSFDQARFEVQMHKYMDLSQGDYGVAVLNDCKYGGRVFESTLELTLLRSAKFPSLHSEQGKQEFKYALLPHAGTVETSRVAECAAAFNREPLMLANVDASSCKLPFALNTANVVLSACKKAEKSDDIIVRLAERCNAVQDVEMTFDTDRIASAGECDLMEWRESANPSSSGVLKLRFKPFEIKTIRLKRK